MGCDIHFHVEKKTDDGWVRAEPTEKNPYFGDRGEPELRHECLYSGRNYSVFAMLADVRNEGGIRDAGDRITPIESPRGLPDDVSEDLRKESEEWGCDGHSHSWFTAAELLAVPWHTNTITHRGYVTPQEFHRFDAWGASPESYCGDTSAQKVTNDEMRRLLSTFAVDPFKSGERKVYTQITWTEPWQASIGDFPWTLVRMAGIATEAKLGLDEVRAVFWFDN